MDLSIIILSFNSKTDLQRLLQSVFASVGNFSFEVIVVDNGSTDGTLDSLKRLKDLKYKDLKIIANKNNGFSHGNNLGIKQAQGKYLLILNPDTELKSNTRYHARLYGEQAGSGHWRLQNIAALG